MDTTKYVFLKVRMVRCYGMKQQGMEAIMAWLQKEPSLKELCREFPEEWQKVECDLAIVFSSGKSSDVQLYLKQTSLVVSRLSRHSPNVLQGPPQKNRTVSELVCFHMARKAVQQHYVAIASGIDSGKVRFNLFNGLLAQWLLFEKDLIRKPVSLPLFHLLWPIVWQRRFLMPLVQPKGIYCFYSGKLILELKKILYGKKCLEIAAGDGTLSRFLTHEEVSITATDDGSWSHSIDYPESVVRLDAKDALRRYGPEAVVCSWPPSNNGFEKQIFVTKSVQQYIMIGSRHTFAAGNWDVYKTQTSFSFEELPHISRLVLPPELDAAVYIFNRKERT